MGLKKELRRQCRRLARPFGPPSWQLNFNSLGNYSVLPIERMMAASVGACGFQPVTRTHCGYGRRSSSLRLPPSLRVVRRLLSCSSESVASPLSLARRSSSLVRSLPPTVALAHCGSARRCLQPVEDQLPPSPPGRVVRRLRVSRSPAGAPDDRSSSPPSSLGVARGGVLVARGRR